MAARTLVPAEARDPCPLSSQSPPAGFHLAELAAEVRIAAPQRLAVLVSLLPWRQPGLEGHGLDAVTSGDLVPQRVGFRKQEVGIQVKDLGLGVQLRCHVQQRHAGGTAKATCQHDIWLILFEGPGQHVLRLPALRAQVYFLQLLR